jgi:AcrR family transcriptional regulator
LTALPASPSANRPDDLKRRLTQAARGILERAGLANLSLRGAARACGVSHMAPYRHFASKDDLLAAVAAQGFHGLSAALDAAAARSGGDPASLELGVAYVLFACENPSLYRLMFGPTLDPCDRFPELTAAGQAAFARCVAAACALGQDCAPPAEGEPPPPAAAALWSLTHGFSSLAIDRLIPLPDDLSARREFITQVLLAGLRGLRGGG